MRFAILILAVWSSYAVAAERDAAERDAAERDAAEWDAIARQWFHSLLTECRTNMVRCLWFKDDAARIGMVMQLNLSDYSAEDFRDMFNFGRKGLLGPRKMSHWQVQTLRKILGDLPPSDPQPDYRWSVFVAVWRNGKVEVSQYDRRRVPPLVQRIYDLGGGYIANEKDG